MYVCLCEGVTEDEIRMLVQEGVNTMAELRHHLGVATGCGKCAEYAMDVLQDTLKKRSGKMITHAPEAPGKLQELYVQRASQT